MRNKAKKGRVLLAFWCAQYVFGCGPGKTDLECDDVCSPAGLSECADGKLRSCRADVPGCLQWSNWATCGAGICADGFSCLGCSNGCAASGNTRCESGNLYQCKADARGCLDWGPAIPCESGSCADGERCGACEDLCSAAGTTECSDAKIRTCVLDAHGCLAWDQAANCPSGTCLDEKTCFVDPAGKLLFDGTFKGNEERTSKNGPVGAFETSCLAQPDSFGVVAASTLPGNRSGYAGKFFQGAGTKYDCATNQHNLLTHFTSNIPNPNRDVWYGYSVMLKSPWNEPGGFMQLGAHVSSAFMCVGSCGNWGLYINHLNGAPMDKFRILNYRRWIDLPSTYETDIWHDWMYHIYWSTTSGSLDVWHRGPADSTYELVYSQDGLPTEQDFGNGEKNYMMNRIGIYRGTSNVESTVYLMDFKIGTTRADVEYRD